MRSSLPLISFAALVLAAGVIHGVRTYRWHPSADLETAAARLDKVPAEFGDWRGEIVPLDDNDLGRSGIRGHSSFRYHNLVTGEKVSLLIVCGRSGRISVHTPDVCYATAGYKAAGDKYPKTIKVERNRTESIWAQRFKAPTTSEFHSSEIEVNWAWSAGKDWVAPENPRWALSGAPILYKLYVVRDVYESAADQKKDPSVSFLQTFLPELEKILSP